MACLTKYASLVMSVMSELHSFANLSLTSIDIITGEGIQRLSAWKPFAFLPIAMENAHHHVSQLPLPRRIGETSILAEIPNPAANSRDGSRKHYLSNCKLAVICCRISLTLHVVPEPAAKRMALVKRAGEPLKPNLPSPPNTRSFNPAANANGEVPPRNFSQSYRPNSSAARTISGSTNSSFSTSVGPSVLKQPSTQIIQR